MTLGDAGWLVCALALAAAPFALVFPAPVAIAAVLVGAVLARRAGLGALVVASLLFVVGAARAVGGEGVHEAERAQALRALVPPASCEGNVTAVASATRLEGGFRVVVVGAWACEGRPVELRGKVAISGVPFAPVRGDVLFVSARLAVPERFWNGPASDPRLGEARRGIVATGGALTVDVVSPGRGLGALVDRARNAARERIEATFAPEVTSLARALVLGEEDLSLADADAFRQSGLLHLLAVSGAHLVVVVAGIERLVLGAFVRLLRWSRTRNVAPLAAFVVMPLPGLYGDFAGSSGSARRAAIMSTWMLASRALGRAPSAPRALAASVLVLAALDPFVATDLSFLLSVAATFGLLALAKPIEATVLRGHELGAGLARTLLRMGTTTLAATLPCAPLLAGVGASLPLGGLLANIVAVPIGELAALPLCLVHAVLEPVPPVERGCAIVASGALLLLRAIARVFGRASFLAVEVPPPTGGQLATLVAAGAAMLLLAARSRGPRVERTGLRRAVAAAAALALGALEVLARREGAPTGLLRVTFLDVGQGDAALVDLPDGTALLVDGGGLVGSPIDTGARVIAPVLRQRRRKALRAVVLSHPHPDHALGLVTGLGAVEVDALWDTGQSEAEAGTEAHAAASAPLALLAAMRARGVRVLRPADVCGERRVGGATLRVLAPCPRFDEVRSANDNSFVVHLAHGGRSVLLVGDAELAEEAWLLAHAPGALAADVLKVGHHGSRTSSSPAFLAAVGPAVAIVSTGVRNRFGHPHPKTLAALGDAAIPALRTDQRGAVTVETEGTRLEVRTASGLVVFARENRGSAGRTARLPIPSGDEALYTGIP